jgi:hypothetical protein
MAEQLRQADMREFERLFSAIRSANRAEREDAVGLLTPALLQRHINQNKPITLPYGRKGYTVSFSVEDLKQFQESLKRVKANNRSNVAGMPLVALDNASHAADKRKMREEIRSATLYKINGNMLAFRVAGSGRHKQQYYQVRIRLEQWHDLMTDARTFLAGARAAAVGNISFDCTCGRHQYWFRYLATMSNCAVAPKEKDFPKIRNPKLSGFCCKHVLKVFQQLKSGSVHNFLAKEMERQANAIGYVSPGKAKFLNTQDLAAMQRARGSDKALAAAMAAYDDFQKARRALKKKLREPAVKEKRKAMEQALFAATEKIKLREAEAKAQKARAKAAEKALSDAKMRQAQLQRDALVGQIGMSVMRGMFQRQLTREQALTEFAQTNKMTYAEVDELAKGAGV